MSQDYWTKIYPSTGEQNIRFGIVREYADSLVTQLRAGIVLYYTEKDGQDESLYFAAGIDYATQEITDFGGHICKYKDRSIIDTAIREFNEETQGLFRDYIDLERIYECPTVFNDTVIIIFVRIPDIHDFDRRIAAHVSFTNIPRSEIRSIIFFRHTIRESQELRFFPLIQKMMQQALTEKVILSTFAA